jgi:uncharacterized protein (TIGR00369 family)
MAEQTRSALTLGDANDIVRSTAFAVDLGYEVTEVGRGVATVRLKTEPRHLRPGGLVAGPILMGLADLAFWIAVQSVIGAEPMALTLEEKTAFLTPARGNVHSEARVLKSGRRVVYGEATTYDATGHIVAHHTLTYLRPQSR